MAASTLQQQQQPAYASNPHTRSPTARTWTSAAMQQSSGSGSSSPRSIRSVASTMQNAGVPQPTEDELNGRTYLAWLNSWDDTQVAKWLGDNRCGSHATTFANNDIRGNVLLDVDQQALKEMGVQSVGDRIKITVAVKKLRQACTAASVNQALASRRPLQHSLSTASLTSNGRDSSAPSSPVFSAVPGQAVVAHAQLGRRVSNGKSAHRIPPPLHLAAASTIGDSRLPQAYQTTPAPMSKSSLPSSDSLGSVATYGARSSSNAAGAALLAAPVNIGGQTNSPGSYSTRLATSPRSGLSQQAALPPPKTQPPPPPGQTSSRPSTSSRQQLAAPTISTTAASPTAASTQASNWSNQPGDYGSLRKPRPSGGMNQYSHRKSGSTGGSISSMSGTGHPYAIAPAQARPSTAAASYQQQQQPFALSPITEANSAAASPVTSEHPSYYSSNPPSSSLRAQQQAQGYTVGKGGFARPTTAGGIVSISASSGSGQVIPLEDVLRKTVKFIGDDGISKMVNVDGARDTQEVLLRALKKFGKIPGHSYPVSNPHRGRNDNGEPFAEMEGYGVFYSAPDGSSKALTEGELWAICLSASRPERVRGLILRRLHVTPSSPEDHRLAKARKLRNFFGEDLSKSAMSPTSPTNMLDISVPATIVEPHSPTPSSPSSGSEIGDDAAPRLPQKLRPQRNTMNRASTVSIMSGLNWGSGNGSPGISQAQARSPSAGFIQSNHQKLRHFFGHRPPSELISSHLVDYFPTVPSEKKILSKAVRNNVRKSMMRRNSSFGGSIAGGSSGKTSWDASRDSQNLQGLGLSRFSVSSAGSNSRASIDTVPPLPTKDGAVLMSRFSEDYDVAPTGRPSLQSQSSSTSVTPSIVLDSDDEDVNDSQSVTSAATRRTSRRSRPSSRLSIWSQSKSNKDSDNASLLTVDEITEDLEKRRMSRASWAVDNGADLATLAADTSGDSTESDAAASSNLDISDDILEGDSTEDDTIEEEDEDEEDEDEDEDSEEADQNEAKAESTVDPDVPQTVTTTTKKATFRWVRGALIGAGSFGQVYLGMNAINGSFMAVKQVELPTGNSHNEERKKSMLSALEREIELLKIIKHENIVQYLDSSSDGKHLYILLEYVPGGSVAHLLANYGAFEEALVRTFVKQILQGLSYLHENDIIHRDIKGANILVDNRGGIKISDFGISKKVEENLLTGGSRLNRPSLQGSVFWMAPEVVKQTSYTAKADIWSLGCLIVEMFTGHHPWFELTQMQAIFKIGVAKDPRPAIPEDFSAEGQSFLDLAFKTDYNERPTAAELLKLDFITQEYDPPAPDSKE